MESTWSAFCCLASSSGPQCHSALEREGGHWQCSDLLNVWTYLPVSAVGDFYQDYFKSISPCFLCVEKV